MTFVYQFLRYCIKNIFFSYLLSILNFQLLIRFFKICVVRPQEGMAPWPLLALSLSIIHYILKNNATEELLMHNSLKITFFTTLFTYNQGLLFTWHHIRGGNRVSITFFFQYIVYRKIQNLCGSWGLVSLSHGLTNIAILKPEMTILRF